MKNKLEFRNKKVLIQMLNESGIGLEDVCLVGSMSLSIRGIREHNDIDVCFRNQDVRSELSLPSGVSMSQDRYEPIGLSNDDIINNSRYHDFVDEFKIIRPEITLAYKKYRNWPKDAEDVELLAKYRENSDEWDETLYQSLNSGSSATLISRGIESLQNDGIITTSIKTIGFFERRYPELSTVRTLLPIQELKSVSTRLSTRQQRCTSAEVLINQYLGSEFSAMDLVLRYDIIKEISNGKKEYLSELHDKGLVNETDIKELNKLYKHPKIVTNTPVKLNYKQRILNPNEFAAKIWHKINDHKISIQFEKKPPVTYDHLQNQGLPQPLLQRLRERRTELLESAGTLFYAILWPPSQGFHEEIQSSLENVRGLTVHRSTDIQIEMFDKFVHKVYEAQEDSTSRNDINAKIKKIEPYGQTIRVLAVELPEPKIRDGISLNMEMLKNDIRQKYIEKLSEDLYYCVIHVTDNYGDNIRTKNVLESHGYINNEDSWVI